MSYEYRVIVCDEYAEHLPKGERKLQDILNDLSSYRWDLVQLMPGTTKADDEIIVRREKM